MAAAHPTMFEEAAPEDKFLLMELYSSVVNMSSRSLRKQMRDYLYGLLHTNTMGTAEEMHHSRKPSSHESAYSARYYAGLLTATSAWRTRGFAGVKKHLREVSVQSRIF